VQSAIEQAMGTGSIGGASSIFAHRLRNTPRPNRAAISPAMIENGL